MIYLRAILLMSFIVLTSIVSFGQINLNTGKSVTCPKKEGYVLYREVCKPGIDWKNMTIATALMTSFSGTETPAGVSLLFEKSGENEAEKDLSPDSLVLSGVLNKLVTIEPRYRWREENGVVNFFPNEDYKIFDVKIIEFKFDNLTKGELLGKLENTDEFKNYLKENKLRTYPLTFCCGLQDPRPPRKFSIDLKNASVKEILNEIVRLNGSSAWIYREYEATWKEKVNRYYSLYFLVQTY